jgi:N-acetylglucosamine-6-phosphate deacetylase
MTVIAGGDLVLPDRLIPRGVVVIENGRIAKVEPGGTLPEGAGVVDASGGYVVPGFVDVHVHGVAGTDTLDEGDAIAAIAASLPRYGVTAFCPTTVACPPAELRRVLEQVSRLRGGATAGARVLPAHLESNFINADYRGAQPADCLRTPAGVAAADDGEFSAQDILDVIAAARRDVGIVTLAPELPGALDLIATLTGAGHRVSLGHSGADYATARAGIDAGARHATHLFNRMTPLAHRAPGIAGAVLNDDEVTAELICDGHHVHPAMCRLAMMAKRAHGVIAITDGTAGSGLAGGATARLGGRRIEVRDDGAFLEDGTLAGSTLTMDRAFRNIVRLFAGSVVEAALMCATTPARALGLAGHGSIEEGAAADLVILDGDFQVRTTFVNGRVAWDRAVNLPAGTAV